MEQSLPNKICVTKRLFQDNLIDNVFEFSAVHGFQMFKFTVG